MAGEDKGRGGEGAVLCSDLLIYFARLAPTLAQLVPPGLGRTVDVDVLQESLSMSTVKGSSPGLAWPGLPGVQLPKSISRSDRAELNMI